MSVESVVGRIAQILALEQQLTGSPAAASSSVTGAQTPPGASSGTGGAGSLTFGQMLASASGATPTVSGSGYVNPLANASVRAERIDQGVDYAGTGSLGAIGPGVVTQVVHTGSGWEGGGYVEYRLTAGPYAGRYVYYAEGVTPTVSVGQALSPGQQVATIIPGYPTGMELGFAAGTGQASYANVYGGGYSEGGMTAAGKAFSDLISSLGGPPGLAEGRQVTGHFP